MPISRDLFVEIDSCKYLYLREISEPRDNEIRLVIEEASVGSERTSVKIGDTELTDLRPIQSTDQSRLFEIVWKKYVAYSVLNESFALPNEREGVIAGSLVEICSTSRFLDYVSKATWASNEFPGPLDHIRINCLNHTVDVVSVDPPRYVDCGPARFSEHAKCPSNRNPAPGRCAHIDGRDYDDVLMANALMRG
jgi:hypothetical protein